MVDREAPPRLEASRAQQLREEHLHPSTAVVGDCDLAIRDCATSAPNCPDELWEARVDAAQVEAELFDRALIRVAAESRRLGFSRSCNPTRTR